MNKPLHVLLVEDSQSDKARIIHHLRQAGYSIQYKRVETKEEMLLALEAQSWDIVISDYFLPQFEAPEALSILKSTNIDIPFIVVSGSVGEDVAVGMMKAGAQDYIMKSNLSRLVPVIEREIQEAKNRQERRTVGAALEEERYLFRTLLNNSPEKIYFKDLQSRFTRISKSLADIFGLQDPLEAVGKTDFDYFSRESATKAFQDEQNIIASNQVIIDLEEKIILDDGRLVWANTSKMPLKNNNDQIVGTFGISSDITQRKQLEELLQARVRLLEYSISHSLDEILLKTLEEAEYFTNSLIGFYHFLESDQHTISLQAWSKRTVAEFCTTQGKGLHYDLDQAGIWADAIRQRSPVIHNNYLSFPDKKGMPEGHAILKRELVVPIIRKNNVVAILGVGNKPYDYADGDIESVTMLADVVWEIVQRKIVEETAKESEARYQNLYEAMPVGMYRTTPSGKFLMANRTLVQMLGYDSFEDLAKINVGDLYRSKSSRREFLQSVEKGGDVSGAVINLIRKDGKDIFLRASGKAFYDESGNVSFYDGTLEDISDFHISQEFNKRLIAAIEFTEEAVVVFDTDGKILYINPAFEKIFGVSNEEVLGKNILILSSIYQDKEMFQQILNVSYSGQVWHGDIKTNNANGSTLEFEITLSPVVDREKNVTSVVCVMRDVTQSRIAEMQGRQSQKLEAIGQLAAGIAHEINTPTQFIGNNLHFLNSGFEDILNLIKFCQNYCQSTDEASSPYTKNGLEELLQTIDLEFLIPEIPAAISGSLEGIGRVTKIVNAMKEFSHPGIREKTLVDINHAIENTIIVSRNEWKYVADLTTELDPDLPQIPCLIDEFNQVILNMITNAVHAIQEKQNIDSDTDKGKISIATSFHDPWIVVKISDSGKGIPERIRDRIFDPFFTTKEVGKGTGQGLAISYDVIVNKHGGHIGFETELDKGTTFIIQLPCNPET